MNLLAQAAPSASALKEFLEVVFYICGLVAAIVVAWRALTGKATATEIADQPIEVRAHAGTVTREELKQVHGRIERERKELDREILRVENATERRMESLESKLDEQTEKLNARIDAIPERTIELLKTTRDLHKP
ncbi:MAG: hypothetical protein JNK23_10560 [Opitutaceae bacterium]|nr:hypothetical protein [Opitutaceae bacterium]